MFDEEFEESSEANIKQLIAQFEEVIEGGDAYYFDTESLEHIVEFYIEGNLFSRALLAIKYAINKYPFSFEFHLMKVDVYISIEKYDEALDILDYLEDLGMTDVNLYRYRGEALMMKGKFKEAIAVFKVSLTKPMDEVDRESIYMDLSFANQELGKFDLAVKYLMKVIEISPENTEAINELGLCIDVYGDYDLGLESFEKIIDRHPYCATAWYYYGVCFSEKGLFEKALEAFEYSYIVDSEFSEGYFEYANTLVKLGQFDEALLFYQKIIADEGPTDDVLKEIGNVYLTKGDYEYARLSYEKAIKHSFGEEYTDELWYLMGLAYEAEEYFVKAKRCYESAFEKFNDSKYMVAIANVERKLGDIDQAYSDFETAIELDPYNETNWLGYANCLFEEKEFKSAQEKIESSLLIMPENARLRYLLSGCMFRNGNSKQAQFELEKALSLDFKNYNQIFVSFPDLERNNDVINLIEQFRNR